MLPSPIYGHYKTRLLLKYSAVIPGYVSNSFDPEEHTSLSRQTPSDLHIDTVSAWCDSGFVICKHAAEVIMS